MKMLSHSTNDRGNSGEILNWIYCSTKSEILNKSKLFNSELNNILIAL